MSSRIGPTNTAEAHAAIAPVQPAAPLGSRYQTVRETTERLARPLSPEDCQIQSMPDASPVKWHLAHTTWFFETFVLAPHASGYEVYKAPFNYLFNSYYNSVGDRLARPRRGLITRPTLEEVYAYRAAIDRAMQAYLASAETALPADVAAVIELGLNHEQQHQELILTDIKHALACNPLRPAYCEASCQQSKARARPLAWSMFAEGLRSIGHAGRGFAFDNEGPRHRVFLDAFQFGSRPVTSGEFLAFIEDGGYSRPELWLADGWNATKTQQWEAPLYWERIDDTWWMMTLGGFHPVMQADPVCHVSYYEADAYARWAGARLPTEAEWEVVARDQEPDGNFLECGHFHPQLAIDGAGIAQCFGDVWEWTGSPYTPYPGSRPAAGALGEYNAKFMCNQLVLRGGSCATPASHVRATYRNFFPRCSLAVFGDPTGERRMTSSSATISRHDETASWRKQFLRDVIQGLRRPQKEIPCKYFYDELGSGLFDEICELDEYYLTRTELAILKTHAPEMAAAIGADCELIEFGSGSGLKTRLLLERVHSPRAYLPVDIARETLRQSAADLTARLPGLRVLPVHADFTEPLLLPETGDPRARRVVYFPGSTIGNFSPNAATNLLCTIAWLVGDGGGLLIGFDLDKDESIVWPAYNDRRGVSAAFNLNVLERINRELGADFDLAAFSHRASYVRAKERMEMYLVSREPQVVQVAGQEIAFDQGEMIHTEYSYKYTLDHFGRLTSRAGFTLANEWLDSRRYFAVQYLIVE